MQLIDVNLSSPTYAFNANVTTQLHSERLASEVSDEKIGSDANASMSVVLPTEVTSQNPVTNRTSKVNTVIGLLDFLMHACCRTTSPYCLKGSRIIHINPHFCFKTKRLFQDRL